MKSYVFSWQRYLLWAKGIFLKIGLLAAYEQSNNHSNVAENAFDNVKVLRCYMMTHCYNIEAYWYPQIFHPAQRSNYKHIQIQITRILFTIILHNSNTIGINIYIACDVLPILLCQQQWWYWNERVARVATDVKNKKEENRNPCCLCETIVCFAVLYCWLPTMMCLWHKGKFVWL